MKYKLVAFWLVVFGALFAFLQTRFEYHFYYIEQSQLFLFTEAYIRNKLLLPGGFSMLVAEFLVQFFIRPYVGALVTAGLLYGWYCETDRTNFGAFYPLCATDVGFAVHAFRLQLQGTGHCLLPDDDGFALWVYEDTE